MDKMLEVKFYDSVDDDKLKFAVIAVRYKNKWVFCKHKERDTYEIPGGHREAGETIYEAANRELFEETGVSEFDIVPICVYSVTGKNAVNNTGDESFGMLYYAEIKSFADLPESEIESVALLDGLPKKWTYPLIQPKLIEKINKQVHQMRLNKEPFEKIKNGTKTIEIRCNDEKRQEIKINDIIVFQLVDEDEMMQVRVKDLYPFKTFYDLYSAFDFSEFGCEGYIMERMLEETEWIYPKDKEQKYGVLGIRVERIEKSSDIYNNPKV